MQYIATLNFLCTRTNGALCSQILELCRTPKTRTELGASLKEIADSSKLSRYLSLLESVGLISNQKNVWQTAPHFLDGANGFPFRVVPVTGVSAAILRLFGSQFHRKRRPRVAGFHEVKGPKASLTIKSISVVLGISREVLQLRLTELVALEILTRNTSRRPYTYELIMRNEA